MATAILQKEIRELKQRQTRLERKVTALLKEWNLPYGNWALKPAAIRRIEKARKQIAAGKGVTFDNHEAMRRYFAQQRHAEQA